ncbi:unnamed protein product [Clonostachys rhizophaga]|uniref:Uncharacterized protein n=1 Tax=Clonostachys rhizophaga TaxID=160324 RepID=A0A9N9YFM4_9HYPO|nr:unnamed protein product [Clonostachys rhizophaga]
MYKTAQNPFQNSIRLGTAMILITLHSPELGKRAFAIGKVAGARQGSVRPQLPREPDLDNDERELLVRLTALLKNLDDTSADSTSSVESHIERAAAESYRPFANAMLATATFAGTITLTVILTPGNSPDIPGLGVLTYASSIFIGCIMACICLITSIEVNVPFAWLRLEATIVGLLLFSAFFLLLLASTLLRDNQGAFTLGCILYFTFGLLILLLGLTDWLPTLKRLPFSVRRIPPTL